MDTQIAAGSMSGCGSWVTAQVAIRPFDENGRCMSDAVLETVLKQVLRSFAVPALRLCWQGAAGGEVAFFKRVLTLVNRFAPPGLGVQHRIWFESAGIEDYLSAFMGDHAIEAALQIRGYPASGADERALLRGLRQLRTQGVGVVLRSSVSSAQAHDALQWYRYLRDGLGVRMVDFVAAPPPLLSAQDYGRFLCTVFDMWVSRDVGKVQVSFFEAVLSSYTQGLSSLCVLQPRCDWGIEIDASGAVYSCHKVRGQTRALGNVQEVALVQLLCGRQQQFSISKSSELPPVCLGCDYLFTCYGECPANRTGQGEQNRLCAGLKAFFVHSEGSMRVMADMLRRGESAAGVMDVLQRVGRQGVDSYRATTAAMAALPLHRRGAVQTLPR
jgi:uncharacterized protein